MGSWKSVVAVAALVCVVVIVAGLGWSFFQVPIVPTPPASTPEIRARDIAQATARANYSGHWCDSANAPRKVMSSEGLDEIVVTASSERSLTFSVMHTGPAPSYRIVGSETTITAPVVDGVATFEFLDDLGSANEGTIELLDDKLVVEIGLADSPNPEANASIAMNCVMLRDRNYASRTVEEPTYNGPFIGVAGRYTRSSGVPNDPCVEIVSVRNGQVILNIVSTSGKVYFKHLNGSIKNRSEAEVHIKGTDAILGLKWKNPGTIVLHHVAGSLSGFLRDLVRWPTYWNSKYLHTS